MNFNEILKALRLQENLTQKQLGEKLNLTISTICDWEKLRSQPNISQLIKLADVLDVSVDFLIGRVSEL